jgi:hypothetical protein
MNKKNAGVTTIVVVCVMAVIMALSLSLFLTASVLMRTASRTLAQEQCRILAETLSEQIEQELTAPSNSYGDVQEEITARAQNINELSLWHYVRQEIMDGAWPYYEEDGSGIHSSENAVRTFQMNTQSVAGEVSSTVLSLYWTPGADETTPESLTVRTEVTVKGRSCSLTDVYRLRTRAGGEYESWEWEHETRK